MAKKTTEEKIMSIVEKIEKELKEVRDEKYKLFHSSLLQTVDPEDILGVRVPMLRKIAKKYKNERGSIRNPKRIPSLLVKR